MHFTICALNKNSGEQTMFTSLSKNGDMYEVRSRKGDTDIHRTFDNIRSAVQSYQKFAADMISEKGELRL